MMNNNFKNLSGDFNLEEALNQARASIKAMILDNIHLVDKKVVISIVRTNSNVLSIPDDITDQALWKIVRDVMDKNDDNVIQQLASLVQRARLEEMKKKDPFFASLLKGMLDKADEAFGVSKDLLGEDEMSGPLFDESVKGYDPFEEKYKKGILKDNISLDPNKRPIVRPLKIRKGMEGLKFNPGEVGTLIELPKISNRVGARSSKAMNIPDHDCENCDKKEDCDGFKEFMESLSQSLYPYRIPFDQTTHTDYEGESIDMNTIRGELSKLLNKIDEDLKEAQDELIKDLKESIEETKALINSQDINKQREFVLEICIGFLDDEDTIINCIKSVMDYVEVPQFVTEENKIEYLKNILKILVRKDDKAVTTTIMAMHQTLKSMLKAQLEEQDKDDEDNIDEEPETKEIVETIVKNNLYKEDWVLDFAFSLVSEVPFEIIDNLYSSFITKFGEYKISLIQNANSHSELEHRMRYNVSQLIGFDISARMELIIKSYIHYFMDNK